MLSKEEKKKKNPKLLQENNLEPFSLYGNQIIFENDDGDEIVIANGGAEIGMADDIYGGYVTLANIDGTDVKLEAGSIENGYGAAAAGEQSDLALIGFNQHTGTTVTSTVVTTDVLAASDNVTINGVAIGDSASDSAADKALAINNLLFIPPDRCLDVSFLL